MNLQHALWKNRQLRHEWRMMWLRYRLKMLDFNTGLGESAWLLHGLTRSLKPETCVEIGSARGWSTCHIGLALRERFHGKLYAIDPHRSTNWNDPGTAETERYIRQHIRVLGLESYVEIVRATSEQAAQNWTRPIDLLFIDGDHSYEGVKRDWELFLPFLRSFGIVVFHDTTWEIHGPNRPDMGVPRFVDDLRKAGHPVITLDRDCGLSFVQNKIGGIPLVPIPLQ